MRSNHSALSRLRFFRFFQNTANPASAINSSLVDFEMIMLTLSTLSKSSLAASQPYQTGYQARVAHAKARSYLTSPLKLVSSLRHSTQSRTPVEPRSTVDRGGNHLRTASSLRPYLQGFALPGTNRSLRDATGRTDPDFYRLFDKDSQPLTFQGSSLLLSGNLNNHSNQPISIVQLNRQGDRIPGSFATVQSGKSFYYPKLLSQETFYLKVTSTAPGQNRYELNLIIINS